jgi:hypothetical protein
MLNNTSLFLLNFKYSFNFQLFSNIQRYLIVEINIIELKGSVDHGEKTIIEACGMERPNCNLQTTNALQVNQIPNHEKTSLPQGPTLYSFLKGRFDLEEITCHQKRRPPFKPYLVET